MGTKCDIACIVGLQTLMHLYKCYCLSEYLVKTVKHEISTNIYQGKVYLFWGNRCHLNDKLTPPFLSPLTSRLEGSMHLVESCTLLTGR